MLLMLDPDWSVTGFCAKFCQFIHALTRDLVNSGRKCLQLQWPQKCQRKRPTSCSIHPQMGQNDGSHGNLDSEKTQINIYNL